MLGASTKFEASRPLEMVRGIVGIALLFVVSPVHAQDAQADDEPTRNNVQAAPKSHPGQALIDNADNIVAIELAICNPFEGKVERRLELSDEEVAAIRKDIRGARHSAGAPNTPDAWDVTVVFKLKSGSSYSAVPAADGLIVDACEPCALRRADASGRPRFDISFVVPTLLEARYWDILKAHLGPPTKVYRMPDKSIFDGLD